jgi:aromatic-amino-acid transaminase
VAATVLTTPELRSLWEQELGRMRERIREMRRALVRKLRERVPGADFSFIERQRGMFSYSGLSREQVVRLREEFAVYAIESGRICVAALNTKNIDYCADGIARVLA